MYISLRSNHGSRHISLRSNHNSRHVYIIYARNTLNLRMSLICSKSLPIIPSSTSQKIFTHSYFIFKSIPIISILFFCFIISYTWWHPGKQGAFVIGTMHSINVSDASKVVNKSHPYLSNWLISRATVSQWFQYIE